MFQDIIARLEKTTTTVPRATQNGLHTDDNEPRPRQSTPKIGLQSIPQIDLQSTPQISLQSIPQIDPQSTPQIDLQSTPQIGLQSTPQIGLQTTPVLALPVCPHVCDSDSAHATTPSSFSPCGDTLPLSLLLVHNLLVPHVH